MEYNDATFILLSIIAIALLTTIGMLAYIIIRNKPAQSKAMGYIVVPKVTGTREAVPFVVVKDTDITIGDEPPTKRDTQKIKVTEGTQKLKPTTLE